MSLQLSRRALVIGAALAAAPVAGQAHTLWGQWMVFRKKHLLILCHRDDPAAFPLAKEIETAMAHDLPQAKCRIARAPFPGRISSLMGTGQMQYALVTPEEAQAMKIAAGEFTPYGPVETRLLAGIDGHVLVCTPDVPDHHAWLLRAVLVEAGFPSAQENPGGLMANHPGASAYDAGIDYETVKARAI